jgi:hypothetical protein
MGAFFSTGSPANRKQEEHLQQLPTVSPHTSSIFVYFLEAREFHLTYLNIVDGTKKFQNHHQFFSYFFSVQLYYWPNPNWLTVPLRHRTCGWRAEHTYARHGAWDLREMGSAGGRGVREGPAPHKVGKISSQCSARKEATWRRKKMEERVGRDEEELAPTE